MTSSEGSDEPQAIDPQILRALESARAYPAEADAQDPVEHIQTHLSHVFLTRSRVYKLRKSVRFDFVDFSTRALRNADCQNEVTLNRRLAPAVYLGVAPILVSPGSTETAGSAGPPADVPAEVRVGTLHDDLSPATSPGGDVPEHCVVMQRLPSSCDALSRVRAGTLTRDDLDVLAERIAHFHAHQRLAEPLSADAWHDRITEPVEGNFATLGDAPLDPESRARLAHTRARARAFMQRFRERFDARRRAGLPVDGHGDLHLQHVWYLPGESGPVVIDCIEFQPAFRELDPAAEVAFLAMDLRYRGRADLAEHFLRSYAAYADDYGLYEVVDYFVSYRAAVRAKVASLAMRDPAISEDQRAASAESVARHLELAERALAEPAPGHVVAITGTIGTGKSTVARQIAHDLGAVLLSSDRVRKRLAGLDPLERAHSEWGQGLYGPGMSDATYRGLLERAEPVLRSGRAVVLDATYSTRERRDALRDWADVTLPGQTPLLVEVRCDPARVRERLAERRARADDASDAGPEHQAASRQSYTAPEEWPAEAHLVLCTDTEDWRDAWRSTLSRLPWKPKAGESA